MVARREAEKALGHIMFSTGKNLRNLWVSTAPAHSRTDHRHDFAGHPSNYMPHSSFFTLLFSRNARGAGSVIGSIALPKTGYPFRTAHPVRRGRGREGGVAGGRAPNPVGFTRGEGQDRPSVRLWASSPYTLRPASSWTRMGPAIVSGTCSPTSPLVLFAASANTRHQQSPNAKKQAVH